MVSLRTQALTLAAMVAFAANSLLCRAALGDGLIDAASYVSVRVLSGAAMLFLLTLPSWRRGNKSSVDVSAALALFAYLVLFAFAYLSLSAGTGALLLFGAVQLTMFGVALWSGERFGLRGWSGLVVAVAGLVYLVAPGVTAPEPVGALLMVGAGIAWGVYSLRGRGVQNPLRSTTGNFLLSVPLCLLVSFISYSHWHVTPTGVLLAVVSGAVASGLGYVTWYAALKGLTASGAATVQLSVPVIAALGGVLLLSEPLTLRMTLSSAAVLGGIAIVLTQRTGPRQTD